MNDNTKIVKSWMFRFIDKKFFIKTIKNQTKEQRGRCFGNFIGTLGASFLENILVGKGVVKAGEEVARGGSKFNAVLSFN